MISFLIIKKQKKLLIFTLFVIKSLSAVENITDLSTCVQQQKQDIFIVFNVGQGNCNLYIPKDENASVILYDCGSLAHPFDKKENRFTL